MLTTTLPLEVGQIVQMLVEVGDRRFLCEARVRDIHGSAFETGAPHCYGVRVPVKGDRLVVTLTLPDALFTMTCQVLASEDEGLVLELPASEAIARTQRRAYPRVPVTGACAIELNFEHDGTFWPPAPASLRDVSDGGCGFLFALELVPGMQARISLEVPDQGEVALIGRVRHCKPAHAPSALPFHIGVEFEDAQLDASAFRGS